MTLLDTPAVKINSHRTKACIKDLLHYLEDFELPLDEVSRHLEILGYDIPTIDAAVTRAAKERRVSYGQNRMLKSLLV